VIWLILDGELKKRIVLADVNVKLVELGGMLEQLKNTILLTLQDSIVATIDHELKMVLKSLLSSSSSENQIYSFLFFI